jgi:hypothetical protein
MSTIPRQRNMIPNLNGGNPAILAAEPTLGVSGFRGYARG